MSNCRLHAPGQTILKRLQVVSFLMLTFSSTQTSAIFQGVAGEALLVPFVLYDDTHQINTTVEIIVPSKVGTAMIPNEFTAPHTTPMTTELPRSTPLNVRYAFYDRIGRHRLDAWLPALPDQILSLNWGSIINTFGLRDRLNGEPGYLVIQPEAGWAGEQADFALSGDASLSFSSRLANIPVFALSNGADSGVESEQPSLGNEVVTPRPSIRVAPLASGVRTGIVDEDPRTVTSFDLYFGKRRATILPIFPGPIWWILPTQPTLLIVWNDRNKTGRDVDVHFNVYDDEANECADRRPLPNQLEIFWIGPPGAPTWSPDYITTETLCTPLPSSPFVFFPPLSGFVRFFLLSPQQDAASVAFSIIFSGTQTKTILAHERGRFLP